MKNVVFFLFAIGFFLSCQMQGNKKSWLDEEPYLDKLKQAARYDFSDIRYIPEFTYQAVDDENLVRLRQEFNLDSIAGSGDEVSKIINLMKWVHSVVRYDGMSDRPVKLNAIDLINLCKKENRALNCRYMATILNECYLAMGLKSRFLTCMQKESDFLDCHVITMVYSSDLEKWLWMDPSYCAYVTDEKGELLGPQEVREKLIEGKNLKLNQEANWDEENCPIGECYLQKYMAKNLYRMDCPAISEFDSETFKPGKTLTYIELLPLDGIEQEPQRYEYREPDSSFTQIRYKTNNPDLFWTKL